MLRTDHQVTLRCGNQVIALDRPCVMGIINATPDSFYKAGRTDGILDRTVEMAGRMLEEGATILDLGGMSTRPGAEPISPGEETDRLLPAIEIVHKHFPQAILSADTYRSIVAKAAIHAGAGMINDISGSLLDTDMVRVIAEFQPAYVIMHMQGTPKNMQQHTDYHDLVPDVLKYFVERLRFLQDQGIFDIVLDPGFGFAKTPEQNYELIRRLRQFRLVGRPLLVGVSRKSTLSITIGRPAEDTLEATTALHMAALLNGASILRVHDVRAARDTIAVFEQLMGVETLKNKRL